MISLPFFASAARPTPLSQPPDARGLTAAMRATGDYADALKEGRPVDEAALAFARCVLDSDEPTICRYPRR